MFKKYNWDLCDTCDCCNEWGDRMQMKGQGLVVSKEGKLANLEQERQLQDTELKYSCFLQRE